MNRTLTITRGTHFYGAACKWAILLDGHLVAKIGNGETQQIQMDDSSHYMQVIALNIFGNPVRGIESATAVIMAGKADCTAAASLNVLGTKIRIECSYNAPVMNKSDFVDVVTGFIVNIFKGDAILERLNDSNNRRKDLEIVCTKDGVHIRWQELEPTHWSLGYGEEVIPYEAAGVTMPKEQLTQELLSQLKNSIRYAIPEQTRFVKNEYGCFALSTNKKSSLY